MVSRAAAGGGGGDSLHSSAEAAQRAGLAAPAAPGRVTSSLLTELCVRFFGPSFLLGGRLSCRYGAPVHAGDTLWAGGTVRERRSEAAGTLLSVDLVCVNQDGAQVTTGTAESALG